MPLGLCVIQLRFPASGSLKEKRQALHSIVDRVRGRFNVSIAEVGSQDSRREAIIAVSCVSSGSDRVHAVLSRVVDFVRDARLDAEIVDYHIDISHPF